MSIYNNKTYIPEIKKTRTLITTSLIAGKTTQRKKMINQLPKFKT